MNNYFKGFDGMNREGKKSNYSSYMSRENIGLNQSEAQIKPINRRATQDKIGYQSKISSQRAYLDSRSKSIPIFDDYDDLQQKTSEVSMAAVERHPGMKKEKTPKKERQRFFEERGPQQEQDDYGYTNGELDRNRQELSRLSRKVSSLLVNGNLDKSNLSKDYSTFRVSFMRTESKIRNSPSPNDNLPSILDVPKKKRILQLKNKFDLITGKEKLGVAPHTTKAQGEKSNIQSSIFESSIKTDQEKKAGSRIKDSQKSILTNKTSMESVLVENASKVETNH